MSNSSIFRIAGFAGILSAILMLATDVHHGSVQRAIRWRMRYWPLCSGSYWWLACICFIVA